jgi:hypothetical protein
MTVDRGGTRLRVSEALGHIADTLSDREIAWLLDEAIAIEEISAALARFPSEAYDFAALAPPPVKGAR